MMITMMKQILEFFDNYVGLVALEAHACLAGTYGIALGLEPQRDLALLHYGGQCRHVELTEFNVWCSQLENFFGGREKAWGKKYGKWKIMR